MSYFKVKIKKTDFLFSLYIRNRDKWKCRYCGKDYSDNRKMLHNSHYWGRNKEGTRYEPDNCMALCFYHHEQLGHGDLRDKYKEMMIEWLGQKRFDSLEIQANSYCKKDDKFMEIKLKELLKEQENGES